MHQEGIGSSSSLFYTVVHKPDKLSKTYGTLTPQCQDDILGSVGPPTPRPLTDLTVCPLRSQKATMPNNYAILCLACRLAFMIHIANMHTKVIACNRYS